MASRTIHLVLALGLLLLLGPTPFPNGLVRGITAAVTSLRADHPELSLPSLEAVLAREPELAEIRAWTVEAALQAGEPDLARSLLLDPRAASFETECQWIEIYLQLGQLDVAVDRMAEQPGRCPSQQERLYRSAVDLFEAADFQVAAELLAQLSVLEPGRAESQLLLGLIEAVRDPEASLSHLVLAIELGAERAELGRQVVRMIEEGREDPAFTLAQIGQLLSRRGEWPLAALAFRNALQLDPGYTEARAYLGLALDQSGQDGLALLEQAALEAPTAALPQVLIGKHWRLHGDSAQALGAFEAAAEIAPDDPTIALDLGLAYAAVGDVAAAKAAYVYAARLDPHNPLVWQLLAQFALEHEIELQSLALPAARRAVALEPQHAGALDLLGYSHYLIGDSVLAGRFLNLAVAADPGSAAAHYHLGLQLLITGDRVGGRQALATALTLDPDGHIGNLALRSLENLPP